MSIQAIYELKTELKRLSIASIDLAKGDFRINKLIPILKKSGEKVPVFQKVANLAEDLISEDEKNRSSILLELLNIVIAIISVQGETSIKGDFIELDLKDHNVETNISYRKLKPIQDALENTGTGRIAVIKEGNENGVFKDIRTVKWLIKALGATYPEINEFAYNKLKEFGDISIVIIKRSIDLKESVVTARKISLISDLMKSKENDFYLSFLNNESSEEVLASAITSLKYKSENLNVVLEYIHHKKKAVRTAAYTTLASFNNQDAINIFIEAYNNNERELIKEGINYINSVEIIELIINKTKDTIYSLISSDKFIEAKSKNQKLDYKDKDVALIIDSLEIICNKNEAKIFDFYKEISKHILDLSLMEHKKTSSYNNAAQVLINNLFCYNTTKSLKLIVDFKDLSVEFIQSSFIASTLIYSSKDVYDEYGKIIKKNKKDPRAIKIIDLFYDLYNSIKNQRYTSVMKVFSDQKFDIRWSDLFIDLDAYEIVSLFIHFKNTNIVKYLMKKATELANKNEYPWEIIRSLLSIKDNKDVPTFVIKTVKDLLKKDLNAYINYDVLRDLPSDYANEVEKLGNDFQKQDLLFVANYLKLKLK